MIRILVVVNDSIFEIGDVFLSLDERYISVEQSIINSCREVNSMRKGQVAKRDWRKAFSELKSELAEEKIFAPKLSTKSHKVAR